MDVKLKNILTKINIDNSHLAYFETGKFVEIKYAKAKKVYTIKLELDEPLPARIYVSTMEAFSKYLSQQDGEVYVALYIKLNQKNYDCKIVKDYITFYVDRKEANPSDYDFLKEQSMNIRNNIINITYSSALLEECLNKLNTSLIFIIIINANNNIIPTK